MRIQKIAENPNLISGIHNYCDRWCERCTFTASCAVYAMEQADPDNDSSSSDINNAEFWQKLATIFEETREMILEWAEKNGVDLSEEALTPIEELLEQQHEETGSHPLARAAENYAFGVSEWFEKESTRVEVINDEAPGSLAAEAKGDVSDLAEVVQWYQFFIAVKLKRGLMSRIDEDDYLAEGDQRDSDGSVKVALIGIDRSISAWKLICDLWPEKADSIHRLLLQLEKLRSGMEKEFPNARGFIRPGFDESTIDLLH